MPYTTEGKNAMLNYLASIATHVGLHTAVPSTGSPNEVTGGSPAYTRQANTFNTASGGNLDNSNAPLFDVPGGVTVTHAGFWSASSGGTLYAYGAITPETYGAQGTYLLTDADLDLNT